MSYIWCCEAIFLWAFCQILFINLMPVSAFKNCDQSVAVVTGGVVVVITFPLPQKHSEMKCLLKCGSNWIELQVCLEQNECSQCTETHSRTESSASPWGRAIALGRPPGKLAWRDPNRAPVNLKNTQPCSPLALLRCESVRPGPSVAPFRWLIAGQIFLKQPPIIRCN